MRHGQPTDDQLYIPATPYDHHVFDQSDMWAWLFGDAHDEFLKLPPMERRQAVKAAFRLHRSLYPEATNLFLTRVLTNVGDLWRGDYAKFLGKAGLKADLTLSLLNDRWVVTKDRTGLYLNQVVA